MNSHLARLFDTAAELLSTARRPLLLSHEKPDGDALGSLAALATVLRSRGAMPDAVLFDELPARYAAFADGGFSILGRSRTVEDLRRCDAVVILDTCAYTQLRPIAEWLRSATQPKLVVDHHVTRDQIADAYVIDETASATCLLLLEWARHAGWRIDGPAARALFVGLAMDTGWFHHSNTDARTLVAAADLVRLGARPHLLYESLFQRDSVSRVRLLGAALTALELHADGKLAVMCLDRAAFARIGASPADTEDIINEPLRIASVQVVVLLVDAGEGVTRVSFRSRASEDGEDIDVAASAATFGGGGHRHASGARISAPLDAVRQRVIDHLTPIVLSHPTPA